MIDADKAHGQAASSAEAVRAYAGTDFHRHIVDTLRALEDCYLSELAHISPDDLQFKQGALRQVMALLAAFNGDRPSVPRI